jgi:hypothetical protein
MHWSLRYVTDVRWAVGGRDFPLLDCWGVVYDVYRHELGIELPRYDHLTTASDRVEVEAAMRGEASPFWTETSLPAEFDVAWYRLLGHPHTAIFVDRSRVLCLDRMGATVRDYRIPAFQRGLQGVYTYAGPTLRNNSRR